MRFFNMEGVTVDYSGGGAASWYEGALFDRTRLELYLREEVYEKFHDVEETVSLKEEFSDISGTGFEQANLRSALSGTARSTNWRVGECIAEVYLQGQHNARFHYNTDRDARNQNASLPGADLVGFIDVDGETVFLFGEVKTSRSAERPPGVLQGRFGMICQLENIKNCESIRGNLIRWMAIKVKERDETDPFRMDFTNACRNYLCNRFQLKLAGVLIRNDQPDERDIVPGHRRLAGQISPPMSLLLSVLYLPIPADRLADFMAEGRN